MEEIHRGLDEQHPKVRIAREQFANEELVTSPRVVPVLERTNDELSDAAHVLALRHTLNPSRRSLRAFHGHPQRDSPRSLGRPMDNMRPVKVMAARPYPRHDGRRFC